MESYTKKSIVYALAVIFLTAVIWICRSDEVNASMEWNSINYYNRAKHLREYCRNWRNSQYEAQGREYLKKTLEAHRAKLDLLSAYKVKKFLDEYPEFHPNKIKEEQYKKLVESRNYNALYEYYEGTDTSDKYHQEIGNLIDEIVYDEMSEAEKSHDATMLRQIGEKCRNWKDVAIIAAQKADKAQEFIDARNAEERARAAEHAWMLLRDSRDDNALCSFARQYADSEYAVQANRRAEELYDDYEFIKSKDTISAYRKYISRNPNGEYVKAASKRIIDLEVEEVAKGKHGVLSVPNRNYNGYGGYGSSAKISLKNSTPYTIEVMYSGSSQSYKRSISARDSTTLTVVPGKYKVVVRALGSTVNPFYGENDLAAGEYSEEFYIQSTRNGVPVSIPYSSFPKYNYP